MELRERELFPATCDPAASLLAYPIQDNFNGVKYPLRWIEKAQIRGWSVVLDAAAFVPTSRFDLTEHPADYVALSYYKMFGSPQPQPNPTVAHC